MVLSHALKPRRIFNFWVNVTFLVPNVMFLSNRDHNFDCWTVFDQEVKKLSSSKSVICATEKCHIYYGKCNIHHRKCNIHQMVTQFQNHASNTDIGKRPPLPTVVMVLIEHSQHIGDRMKRDAIFQMSIISPQLFIHFRIISFTKQSFLLM